MRNGPERGTEPGQTIARPVQQWQWLHCHSLSAAGTSSLVGIGLSLLSLTVQWSSATLAPRMKLARDTAGFGTPSVRPIACVLSAALTGRRRKRSSSSCPPRRHAASVRSFCRRVRRLRQAAHPSPPFPIRQEDDLRRRAPRGIQPSVLARPPPAMSAKGHARCRRTLPGVVEAQRRLLELATVRAAASDASAAPIEQPTPAYFLTSRPKPDQVYDEAPK